MRKINPEEYQKRLDKISELFAGMVTHADEVAVQVPTSCGGMGHCHECVVEVKRGMEALCPRTEPESFLRGDYRLACQAVIRNADCDVEFALLRRRPQILTSTPEKPLE